MIYSTCSRINVICLFHLSPYDKPSNPFGFAGRRGEGERCWSFSSFHQMERDGYREKELEDVSSHRIRDHGKITDSRWMFHYSTSCTTNAVELFRCVRTFVYPWANVNKMDFSYIHGFHGCLFCGQFMRSERQSKICFVHFLQVAWDGDGNAEVTLPGHYKGAVFILLFFSNIITNWRLDIDKSF